jgi:hypothetical protein
MKVVGGRFGVFDKSKRGNRSEPSLASTPAGLAELTVECLSGPSTIG